MTDATRRVSLAIAPQTNNTLRAPLETVACWRVGDGVFRHDHKVIHPSAKASFREFWEIRDRHPEAPVALFGHADPTGDDDHNHDLGAERAQAVYAVLNQDPDMWFELFAPDSKALANLKAILGEYGYDSNESGYGPDTRSAVLRYMSDLGGGRSLEPFDYLDDGAFAMQSCGEFNPVVRPGKHLIKQLNTIERRSVQAVNRRVLAYFFIPGTYAGERWPCPVAGEGTQKCRARFWSGASLRRRDPKEPQQYWPRGAKGQPRKPFQRSEQTFACRFYERMVRGHRCELVNPWRPKIDEPDPDPDPDPQPDPEEDPDLWIIKVSCTHGRHFNRNFLRGHVTARDFIEVVPGVGGDTITLSTLQPEVAAWKIGTFEDTAKVTRFDVPQIELEDPKPWDLLEVTPVSRTIEATRDGLTRTCYLDAYPNAEYNVSLEPYRKFLRDDVWDLPLKAIRLAAGFLAENFELEVLEKDDFSGKIEMGWKEFRRSSTGRGHNRAYLGFLLDFKADPLIRNSFDMEFSVGKFLKKLKKNSWLKKQLDRLPARIKTAIEAIKLVGSAEVSGGGHQKVLVDAPDTGIPKVGPDKSNKVEIKGSNTITWVAEVDLEKVFSDKDWTELGTLKVSISFGFSFVLGLILDVEDKREIGAYLKGRIEAASYDFELGLPFGKVLHGTGTLGQKDAFGPFTAMLGFDALG